jgi:hypothetical protein
MKVSGTYWTEAACGSVRRYKKEALVGFSLGPKQSQWATKCDAEIILPQRSDWFTIVIIEPIIGIKEVIAEILEYASME